MNTTIYIFGNLPVFQAALTGLQMIFNPANNTDWAVGGSLFGVGPVVGIGLLISLLHVTTKGVWTQKMSLHHVGIMLGLYAAMFIPTTSVQVQDIYTGQTVIVDKIPIGVAYPAAIVSQLSYDAATQLGQAFQMATATAPTTDISQGFAEPLQQMLQMRRLYQNYVKTKPDLADSEFSFFQQCVYPVYSSNTTLQAAYNETNDILATVTNTNYVTSSGANMMVNVLGGPGNAICASSQGCVLTCNGLASTLQTQYNAWKTSSGSGSCTAAVAMAGAAKSDTAQPPSSCTTAASDLGNVLAQLGTNGDQYINQMVHGCMASAGMSAGGSLFAGTPSMSVLPSYCLITQNSLSQAQVDNAGAASMFLKNMLPLMSVLQFLFIAMAPLAAFTMVMAGAQGMGMFVKYIMFGLWTQSWLPVAAMLNDYSQITLAHTLGVLGQAVTGVSANITTAATSVTLASMPPPPPNGLTLTTLPTVLEATMQALSNADMLLAMTPIITMIVFTGSYMGMAQLAQDMGGEDKVSQNTSEETPSLGRQEKAFGMSAPGNASGSYMVTDGAYDGAGFSYGSALTTGVSAAEQRAATATNSYSQSVAHQAQTTTAMMNQYGEKFGQTAAFNTTGGHELTTAWKTMQGFAKETGVTSDQLASFAAMYKGQLDLGKDPKAAMGRVMQSANKVLGGLTGNEENKIASAIKNSEVQKAANELSSGESAKLITQASRESNVAKAETDSQSLNKQVADTKNAQTSAQDAIAQSNTLKEEASAQSSVSGSEQVNQKTISATAASRGQTLDDGMATQIAMHAADPHQALAAYEAQRARLKATGMHNGEALTAAALTLAGASDKGNLGVALGQYVYGQGFGGNVPQAAHDLTNRVNTGYNETAGVVTQGTNSLNPAATSAGNADKQVPAAVAAGLNKGRQVKAAATATTNANTPEGVYASGSGAVQSHHVDGFSKQFQGIAQQVKDAPAMPVLQWGQQHPEEFVAALAAANAIGPLLPAAGAAIGMGAKKAWSALKNEFGPGAAAAAGEGGAAAAGEGAAVAAGEAAAGAGGVATVAELGATVVAGAYAALGVGVAGGVGIAVGTAINYAPKAFGSNETVSEMLAGGADQLLNGNSDTAKTWQEGYNKAIQTPQYKATQAKIKELTDSGKGMDSPEVKPLAQANASLINQTVAEIRAESKGEPPSPGNTAMPGI